MGDPVTIQRWIYWAALVLISALILFAKLLPTDLSAGRWPGPDLMVAIAFAWVLRRPDFTPVLLIGILFLFNDLFLSRPPGLWAALAVAGVEFLRSRSQFSRDLPFPVEWVMVASVLLVMTLTQRLILGILVVPQTDFARDILLLAATIIAYPVVVFASSQVLGVRKVAHGEVDQLGHRI